LGSYSPAPLLTDSELVRAGQLILDPWLEGCGAEGIDYRGILYTGVMVTKDGPKVLEFYSRFGDPETQVYLPRLENDLVELLDASARGELAGMELKWRPDAAVCVVMASGGYPGAYEKRKVITGIEQAEASGNVKVFHAGTTRRNGVLVTNGGRVLGVTAWGTDLIIARDAAYGAVGQIHFEGAQFRRDISSKALATSA
jgi:phosphoribosylamine--glycine ligase